MTRRYLENIFMNHDDIFENDCIFFFKNFFGSWTNILKTFSELSQSYDDIFSSNLENIFKDDCIFFKNFLEIMMTSSKILFFRVESTS